MNHSCELGAAILGTWVWAAESRRKDTYHMMSGSTQSIPLEEFARQDTYNIMQIDNTAFRVSLLSKVPFSYEYKPWPPKLASQISLPYKN